MSSAVVSGASGVKAIPHLLRNPFGFCMSTALSGSGVARIKAGPVSAYLVHDPIQVRRVLIDNASNYIKGPVMDGIRVALGNGLFTADGAEWRRQRRLMQPIFGAAHLARISDVVNSALAQAIDRWNPIADKHEQIDVLSDFIRLNTEIVFRTLIGVDVDPAEHATMEALIDAVFIGMSKRMWTFFVPPWLPTPGRTAYRRAVKEFDQKIYRIIATRQAKQDFAREDLLSLLLSDGSMTNQQLRDEMFTIFLAGNESTASSLTWTIHLLTQHPEIMVKLQAEVDAVALDTAPSIQDIRAMPYLDKVIQEGFRLFPAFPMYFRTAVSTDTLGEYIVPAGAYIVICPYATHRDARYWSEPELFDPERFNSERFTQQARQAYYPFGIGQRRCIGEGVSLLIAKLTLATLVRRYELSSTTNQWVPGRYAMTYQPKGGLPVTLSLRK